MDSRQSALMSIFLHVYCIVCKISNVCFDDNNKQPDAASRIIIKQKLSKKFAKMLRLRYLKFISASCPTQCSKRNVSSMKRFYRNTGILSSNENEYEITLDQRKLKTPLGKVFKVKSKPLALAVAHEWDSQKTTINRSLMHLTALCSTVLDNPNNLTQEDIVKYIVDYLETDTLLFQSNQSDENNTDELYKLQEKKWDPLIQWFCDRHRVDIVKTKSIDTPNIPSNTKDEMRKHLLSYNIEAIFGLMYAVDTVKSVILTLAALERLVTVEEAVALSRLEEEFQISHWGNVEWSHELTKYDLQSRMSAAILFVHLNSSYVTTSSSKSKTESTNY